MEQKPLTAAERLQAKEKQLQEAQQAGFSPALLSKYAGDPEVQALITEFQHIMG